MQVSFPSYLSSCVSLLVTKQCQCLKSENRKVKDEERAGKLCDESGDKMKKEEMKKTRDDDGRRLAQG